MHIGGDVFGGNGDTKDTGALRVIALYHYYATNKTPHLIQRGGNGDTKVAGEYTSLKVAGEYTSLDR